MSEVSRDGRRSATRRRAVLLSAAAGVGAWWAWPKLAPLTVGRFDFQPVGSPEGFRRIAGGRTSGLPGALVGLGGHDPAGEASADEAAIRADLCAALFGRPPGRGVVPIAAFSDYNCPFCRVLTGRLAVLQESSAGAVRVGWHEWPLLGATSRAAARAALAADMQGAYPEFQQRLMRARFLPTSAFLHAIAGDIGVDPARLLRDMESEAVSERLRTTEALAQIFGFPGTPALVVGRTIVVGAVSEATIGALVQRERRDGPPPVCAS